MEDKDKQKQDKAGQETSGKKDQTQSAKSGKEGVQGEGDYDAARRYDKEQEEFAKSGRVDEEARKAAPRDDKQAEELKRAEEEARNHPKQKGK